MGERCTFMVKYGKMEVIKQKACSNYGIIDYRHVVETKKQFLSTQIIKKYHSYPLTSMEHNSHKYAPQKMKWAYI